MEQRGSIGTDFPLLAQAIPGSAEIIATGPIAAFSLARSDLHMPVAVEAPPPPDLNGNAAAFGVAFAAAYRSTFGTPQGPPQALAAEPAPYFRRG